MKIAVASGKGGTGKTTVALALAETLGKRGRLLDCDVEEPNCHLFLGSDLVRSENVEVPVPQFDPERCTGCGACARSCNFRAIAALGKKMLFFPELCHSCGGCKRICKAGAITETMHGIGRLEYRAAAGIELISGVMNVGYPMAVPVIRKLKERALPDRVNILDCPPGTACPMVSAVRGADFVLLVTEPTVFGLHDLELACDTLEELHLRCGVIINRADDNCGDVEAFCRKRGIPILMKIPFSRKIAEGYSSGRRLAECAPELNGEFEALLASVCEGGLVRQ